MGKDPSALFPKTQKPMSMELEFDPSEAVGAEEEESPAAGPVPERERRVKSQDKV
jgi:hypothetical protein